MIMQSTLNQPHQRLEPAAPPRWAFVVAAWWLWLSATAHRLAAWVDDRALLVEAYVWHGWQRGRVRWGLVASVTMIGTVFLAESVRGGAIAWVYSSLPSVQAL